MRILIDECVDERLRLLFPGHDCQTARFANLAGLAPAALIAIGSISASDVVRIR